jgi:hypothetical protein
VDLAFSLDRDSSSVGIEARVRTRGRTGVEMEALTAVTVAALTLYDMLKAVDRGMVMGEFALWEKRGGPQWRLPSSPVGPCGMPRRAPKCWPPPSRFPPSRCRWPRRSAARW